MSNFENQLIERYGPLITKRQLAELLHRSEKGLSYSLAHPAGNVFSICLNEKKVRLGRNVYWRAQDIAALLAGGQA